MPERQVFLSNTNKIFQISYVGGNGNDVVLTYLGSGVVVTTTAATGAGSLIDAINATNATPGAELIAFDLPVVSLVNGAYLIDEGTNPLPPILDTVIIDASTQREYVDKPVIELRSPSGQQGLRLRTTAAGSVIRGLSITGWQTGVDVGANNSLIAGNYIGLAPNGTLSQRNQVNIAVTGGVTNVLIGGTTTRNRNVISAAQDFGVVIQGASQNFVQGNYIGTDPTGLASRANLGGGIRIVRDLVSASNQNVIGGTASGAGNLISGNSGNGQAGILVDVSGLVIGTSVGENQILGKTIGLSVDGTATLGNDIGIKLANQTNTTFVGGSIAGSRNIISGNSTYGIQITGSTLNIVAGNFIGIDPTGLIARPNGGQPIFMDGASNNTIGSSGVNGRNLIVGLNSNTTGIEIANASNGNAVQNNWIGINASGTAALGALASGISITSNSQFNQIGGVGPGNVELGNLIGGVQTGILISGLGTINNSLKNNTIGLNATATAAIPNVLGVSLSGAGTNFIGGLATKERNIISGNSIGISITNGSVASQVIGNWIGTDAAGATSSGYPNTLYGVQVINATRTVLNGNTIVRSGTAGASTNNSGVNLVSGDTQLTRNFIHHNLGPSIVVANSIAKIALTQARVDGFAIGNITGATANTTYSIEFFAANLQGQAEQYIGLSAVATDENGEAVFEASGLGDLPPGRFLTATITGANAEGGDLLQTSELAAGVIPTAEIIRGLPSRSPEGTPISLKAFAVASTVNGYAVTGYQWNVTKGGIRYATGTEAGIQFAPEDEGTYIVTLQLTLTNALGDQQTAVLGPHSIAVFNVAPTPQFDYSPSSPRLGQLLTLKSNSSDPGQLDVLSYAWEVRYGSATGPVVFSTTASTNPAAAIASFTPVAGGLYFPKLTIDDNDGGATGFRTLTRQIEVTGLPATVTILAPSTGSEGQTVRARVPESELIRAEASTAGSGMSPGFGGGGMFGSLLGGMFGAAAGMWLYDQFSGNHGNAWGADQDNRNDGSTGFSGQDTDYSGTGGDFGGDSGGGDSGGDSGGGGDF